MAFMSREKATLYHTCRLPYSADAVRSLLRVTGPVVTLADLGAGTGLLTAHFVGRCARIFAIEPDGEMGSMARLNLRDQNTVQVINARAEQTTLPDSSIQMVVIGNAYHRFPPEPTRAELGRILKPEGWLAIFSYAFHQTAREDALRERLSSLPAWTARQAGARYDVPLEELFGRSQRLRRLESPTTRQESWETWIGAALGAMEAPGRDDPERTEFVRHHMECFDDVAVDGRITIEYSTQVVFAQPIYWV